MKQFELIENINTIANGETRNVAFAKDINRCINRDNVNAIYQNMVVKGYKRAEMIQVIPAEVALQKDSDITIVSITGETIPTDKAHEYFLVLDGQHRVCATSLYNQYLESQG